MEAFESFVALALESEGFIVSEALKFPVTQQTPSGLQTHGYEVDLVGARANRLVLASVKSFFGSRGVVAEHVAGEATKPAFNKRYALLNNVFVWDTVVEGAARRFGYSADQVELRLYVGKFADKGGSHETRVRQWCAQQRVGAGPIQVVGVEDVVARVRAVASTSRVPRPSSQQSPKGDGRPTGMSLKRAAAPAARKPSVTGFGEEATRCLTCTAS